MAGGSSVQVLRDINTLFEAGTVSGLSDRQLLERFSTGRDASAEAAFEAIVQRHGPMVYRLCYKLLGNQADAEEAFQATFLVLVKKSRSIRKLDTVGGWLFGVASRVAARAQVERARRRSAEQQGGLRIAAAADSCHEGGDRVELGAVVEAEVLRLPEKYRAVVVLCYWEGLTHEQAAGRLGCPLGTVRSRMARARDLLERRLTRRGLEPVAGVMAAALDSGALSTTRALEIPSALISSTARLATQVAAGGALGQLASPAIATLVQNTIGSMFMTKVKTIAVCVLLLSAGAYGLALAAQTERVRRKTPDRGQPPVATKSTKSKAAPPLKLMSEYAVEPPDLLVVEVLEALPGRPISGERLVRPDGKISLGFYGDLYVAGLTLPELKEKIVLHMRQYLQDETLGLIKLDPEEGTPMHDPKTNEEIKISPRDTDRVFVDVSAYNSKNYYIEGEFMVCGKIPVTGQERVLDGIAYASGLTPWADNDQVFLYRDRGPGEAPQTLKIDIDEIRLGDDLSTNYQLLPGDKLVARRRKDLQEMKPDSQQTPSASRPKPELNTTSNYWFNRREPLAQPSDESADARAKGAQDPGLKRLDRRMTEMERKLDQILEALKRPAG